MRRWLSAAFVMVVVVALGPVPARAGAEVTHLEIGTARAPVAPDGTTAGEFTDFVMTLVDPDPEVDGISLLEGAGVTVTVPPAFVYTGGGPNALVLLQGWPQSPPAPPPDFLWTTVVSGNTITATLDSDFLVGEFGPGFKQVHALLDGFRNPPAGRYRVMVEIQPDPSSPDTISGSGIVSIQPRSRPAISAVSVFSGGGPPPPFNNAIYQSVAPGEAANPVGLYLWDRGSSIADGIINPLLGVDVLMANPHRGRLVQGQRTVGFVRIDAPAGADEFALTTDGPSTLGISAVTAIDVGILLTHFTTDPDVSGQYTITLRLRGGDSQGLFVEAGGASS